MTAASSNAGWDPDPAGTTWAACLQSAIAAPSLHNSQPWRFRLGAHHVDVFIDPSRRLAAIDPMGREAMIGVGAAVLNLRVAILAAGRIPLTQLLPSPDEPELAARITLGASHQPDATVLALQSAIGKRRTNRHPFRNIEVREEVLDQLTAAARVEAATLTVADPAGRDVMLDVIRSAQDTQPRDAWFEAAPTMVMLSTEADTAVHWLRAGQAMERVLLAATVRGVANTPMTAPTEVPELRRLLSESADRRVAQVILRLGYGDPCAPTPRRPLADVLESTRTAFASQRKSQPRRPGAWRG